MAKVELVKIEDKKQAQRVAEIAMSPAERLQICLDLMDLYSSIRQTARKELQIFEDIRWIELHHK